MSRATDLAGYVAGFVVAEGCFTAADEASRFTLSVGLAGADEVTCEILHAFFGVGHITRSPRRRPHYDDEVCFAVRALPDLVEVIVPFMDEHLAPSYKRIQYEAWRAALLDYWEHRAKRVRACTVADCDRPTGPRACVARTTSRPTADDRPARPPSGRAVLVVYDPGVAHRSRSPELTIRPPSPRPGAQ